MKRIAILLTVFNRKVQTLQCLKNIYEQVGIDNLILDIYLTNDGCTDGTPEAIRKDFPKVHIVEGDGNLYWNRGMHAAWKEAAKSDYDFYLWLNDDTFLYHDAIARLVASSSNHQDESVIIGSCCATNNKELVTYGGRDENANLLRNVAAEQKCVIFNGNIVLIPNFIFKNVGMNDPFYRHSFGDYDYSLKVYHKGLTSFIAVGLFGECDVHTNLPKWCDPKINLQRRIKYLYQPGGNGSNPIELFHYRRKYRGLLPACLTFISNHIHVLFPQLWMKK